MLKEDYWSKARDWCCRAHGSGAFAIISLKIFKLKIIMPFLRLREDVGDRLDHSGKCTAHRRRCSPPGFLSGKLSGISDGKSPDSVGEGGSLEKFHAGADSQHAGDQSAERDVVFAVCFRHRQQFVERNVDHDARHKRE